MISFPIDGDNVNFPEIFSNSDREGTISESDSVVKRRMVRAWIHVTFYEEGEVSVSGFQFVFTT